MFASDQWVIETDKREMFTTTKEADVFFSTAPYLQHLVKMRPSTAHNYSFTFPFEDAFVFEDHIRWMERNWTASIYYAAIYVVVIFGIKNFMENRKKFELRAPLAFWNVGLATFSLIGAVRVFSETVTMLAHDGFYYTICYAGLLERNNVSGFWVWMMTLSKLVELGDTVFIVLRKQPLIFLHWYHHISVLIYSWFSFAQTPSTGRWFVLMNYSVHAVMYGYYALRAMRYSPPKRIVMVITVLQLVQMVMGCYVNLEARRLIGNGVECHTPILNVNVALLLYASYFLLFAKFFHEAYFRVNKEKLDIQKPKVK